MVEGLSALVGKAVEVRNFQSYLMHDNLHISRMQFADDTIVIRKTAWDNLWSIKTIIRSFELVSRLKVNFHKSKLIGIHIPADFLEAT